MTILYIPIPKAGPDFRIELDSEKITQEIYEQIFEAGAALVLGARMTGKAFQSMTKMSTSELATAHAEAKKRAQENLESLYAGEMPTKRKTASKTKGVDVLVVKEALSLAVEKIKDMLRGAKLPVGQYAPSELNAFAKDMIEADPSYLEEAKVRVEKRQSMSMPETLRELLDALQPSPTRVKRAATAKADRAAKKAAEGPGKPKAPRGIVAAARKPQPIHTGTTH